MFEAYLTFYIPFKIERQKISLAEVEGQFYDKRSSFEYYQDQMKEENTNLMVRLSNYLNYFSQYDSNILPLSSISNSYNVLLCNENGYYITYKTDEFGFNNPDGEWDANEIEYFLVGDSFTFGECINRPNDMGSVLRSISKKRVLNLGNPGNGPFANFASVKEYLGNNVKNLIWFHYEGNDIEDTLREKESEILLKYLKNSNFNQNLKNKQIQINKIADEVITLSLDNRLKKDKNIIFIGLTFDDLKKFLKFQKTRLMFASRPRPEIPKEFSAILKETKLFADKNNTNFYLVYLPEHFRYSSINYNDAHRQKIKKMAQKLKINFIDVHEEIFVNEKSPLNLFPFKMHGHYTVEGYRKVANRIYDIITQ